MYEEPLPLILTCCNPRCPTVPQKGEYFCSDSCRMDVQRSRDPRDPVRFPMKHETHPKREGDISYRTKMTYPDNKS